MIAGGKEYTSQSGQVTIADVLQGTLNFTVTNGNEAGYPDVVTYKGSIEVGSPVNPGAGPSQPEGTTVYIAVVGKEGNLLFGPDSVTVFDSDRFGRTAMGALDKTGLSWEFSADWDGFIVAIAGERNEGMNGWCYSVNGAMPSVLPLDKAVSEGDRIIYWYSTDAMSSGPSWEDLTSGNLPVPVLKPTPVNEQVIKAAKETLGNYTDVLAGLREKSKVLNADKMMTREQAQALQKELDSNTVSLSQEAGQSETVLVDAKAEVLMLVPEMALAEAKTLIVKEVVASNETQQGQAKVVSSLYDFGPSGTKFDKPVTISLKFALTEDVKIEHLTPAWYDEALKEWIPVPGVIDMEKGLVVFQINHFTKFAVIEWAPVSMVAANRVTFADVGEGMAWAKDAIETLAGRGIIKGTGKGCFEPRRPVTRAEFVAMVVNALELKAGKYDGVRFNDVRPTDWFAGVVNCACENNIIAGYPDGTFRPNQKISRNEMACILHRLPIVSGDSPTGPVGIRDIDTIPVWALEGVKYVIKQGLMRGCEDQTFRGGKPATRAEAAVVVYRYIKSFPGKAVI